MVRAMTAHFDSDPADLVAAIGPCIGPCCYEVGAEVIDGVRGVFAGAEELLRRAGEQGSRGAGEKNGDRRNFDLPEANRRNLAAAGVRAIETADLCTACRTDLFFSHRAERGRTGRFGTVFALM